MKTILIRWLLSIFSTFRIQVMCMLSIKRKFAKHLQLPHTHIRKSNFWHSLSNLSMKSTIPIRWFISFENLHLQRDSDPYGSYHTDYAMFADDIFIWATEQHQGSSQVTNKWFLLFSTSAFGGRPIHCWINPFTPTFVLIIFLQRSWQTQFYRVFQFFKASPHFIKLFGPLVGWFRMGAILILFMFIKQCH